MSQLAVKSRITRSDESKSEKVSKACLYQISTGTWAPGLRLPSTREGARLWKVSPLTVLHAYQRLIEMGLVQSTERSGFYVKAGDALARVTKHKHLLEGLYEEIAALIRKRTALLPSGALHYLHQMALERARQAPECAFIECTTFQSEDLAGQVESILRVPCLAITTGQLSEAHSAIPGCVRTLLTTGFHYEEVAAVAESLDLRLCNVPIEPDHDFAARISKLGQEVLLLSLDVEQAEMVATDLASLPEGESLSIAPASSTSHNIEDALVDWLGDPENPNKNRVAVLSTTLWSSISITWEHCPQVLPYAFHIRESAWPEIAGIIGLPLGAV